MHVHNNDSFRRVLYKRKQTKRCTTVVAIESGPNKEHDLYLENLAADCCQTGHHLHHNGLRQKRQYLAPHSLGFLPILVEKGCGTQNLNRVAYWNVLRGGRMLCFTPTPQSLNATAQFPRARTARKRNLAAMQRNNGSQQQGLEISTVLYS